MDDALSHVLAVVFALLAAMCAAVGMVVRQRAIQEIRLVANHPTTYW